MPQRLVTAVLLVLLAGSAEASITITNDQTTAYIFDGSVSDFVSLNDTGGGVSEAIVPGYSSKTTGNYMTPGNSASFSAAFDQVRPGTQNAELDGYTIVNFTSDVDVPYTASGTYSSPDGFTFYQGYLFDSTMSSLNYYSEQSSFGGAAFALGGTSGNNYNDSRGSLTGTILAGHNYQWLVYGFNGAYPVGDMGALAQGVATLTLGDAAAAPEPTQLIVWSILAGCGGMAGVLLRRHK